MRISLLRFGALTLAALLGVLMVAGCGGEKAEEEEIEGVEDFWARASEADKNISSCHMEITSYYLNTQYGSGPMQSMIIEVNGDDLHEKELLFGQVYAEYIKVDGKQYSKDMLEDTWKELTASALEDTAAEYTSQFLELPTKASSHEHLGSEAIDGVEAERFHFTLSPLRIVNMFSATTPNFDFSGNGGGEVDVWIDTENYYMVRYDLVIKGVVIPEEIGLGDIRFVVNISQINQPIEIIAPI
ncbi:MAG: hypothetical protein ACOC78_01295 [Actinomycetota bacterium]